MTASALYISSLVAGAIQVEVVFSWPGMGLAIYNSVLARDYPGDTALEAAHPGVGHHPELGLGIRLLVRLRVRHPQRAWPFPASRDSEQACRQA